MKVIESHWDGKVMDRTIASQTLCELVTHAIIIVMAMAMAMAMAGGIRHPPCAGVAVFVSLYQVPDGTEQ